VDPEEARPKARSTESRAAALLPLRSARIESAGSASSTGGGAGFLQWRRRGSSRARWICSAGFDRRWPPPPRLSPERALLFRSMNRAFAFLFADGSSEELSSLQAEELAGPVPFVMAGVS